MYGYYNGDRDWKSIKHFSIFNKIWSPILYEYHISANFDEVWLRENSGNARVIAEGRDQMRNITNQRRACKPRRPCSSKLRKQLRELGYGSKTLWNRSKLCYIREIQLNFDIELIKKAQILRHSGKTITRREVFLGQGGLYENEIFEYFHRDLEYGHQWPKLLGFDNWGVKWNKYSM